MKGDRVEIVIDTGGSAQTYEITATRAGRKVEVSDVTRGGQAVRTGRCMATRVIALVDHPASDQPDASESPARSRPPRTEQIETLL